MQKMKTRSAAKKRFIKVGKKKSKIKFSRAFRRHLLAKKSTKKKRQLRKGSYIAKVDISSVMCLLPY